MEYILVQTRHCVHEQIPIKFTYFGIYILNIFHISPKRPPERLYHYRLYFIQKYVFCCQDKTHLLFQGE